MKVLLPPIKPYAQHTLPVTSPHKIYIEESGEPTGIPILFVHGGPGAGCSADDRRFFDPQQYRIILFDQRGCGHSTPHSSIENNTTAALIEDMEAIRKHLKISQWILFGGSWGATLSLLYAQKYPQHVKGMILRGVFLARESDLRWFYQEGACRVFPDHWKDFIYPIPEEEREDLIAAYYKRLTSENELARMNAAKHWAQWEGQCATLHPCKTVCDRFTEPHMAISLSLIETHYFMNKCFIEPNQIFRDAYKLEGIPGIIVHGRYDMVCPVDNAYILHQAWSGSQLHIVRDAGHSASDPSLTDVLINATETMVKLVRGS